MEGRMIKADYLMVYLLRAFRRIKPQSSIFSTSNSSSLLNNWTHVAFFDHIIKEIAEVLFAYIQLNVRWSSMALNRRVKYF